MQNQHFYSYTKLSITSEDLSYIQKLYLPIIGPAAQTLYFAINDYNFDGKSNVNNAANTILILIKSLSLSHKEFINARKLLEATGLLKTYLSSDEKKFIFQLLPPLLPVKFFSNKLLKNLLLKQIGEIRLDNIMHLYKTVNMNLDDYSNISIQFQDLFNLSELSSDQISLTREMELPRLSSLDEAIEVLSSIQFFKYLTNRFPTSIEIARIKNLQSLDISNPSLNLIINHSFNKNGSVIFNYMDVIVEDFNRKSINTFLEIKDSLDFSFSKKRNELLDDKKETFTHPKSAADIFEGMISN